MIEPSGRVGDVSIHAPARGRAKRTTQVEPPYWCFNPRPRAGASSLSSLKMLWFCPFQSTPPRGGEPVQGCP